MQGKVISFWLAAMLLGVSATDAQIRRQFSVEGNDNVEEIHLNFGVNSGICSIKAGDGDEAVTVYSNKDYEEYNHSFSKSIEGESCYVNLSLKDKDARGLGQSISRSMFGNSREVSSSLWRVYLNRDQVYHLDLNYGLGKADIDLSGVAVRNLKIHTGSADINVGYFSDVSNAVAMDTFYVKVDMGSIAVKQLNLAKSGFFKADVGFGDLLLDLSGENHHKGTIHSSVGAGNLFILLPDEKTPMIIKVHDSWLCQVKLSNNFQKVGENTFVNQAYDENAENLLSFYLDVSMGNIVFKEHSSSKN